MKRIIISAAAVLLAAFTLTQQPLHRAQAADAPQAAQRTVAQPMPQSSAGDDPFIWLEDKDGTRSLDWVRAENAKSLPVLQRDPHYATLYADALKIAESKARIPYPSTLHGHLYNFWQDATHVRGIWRRTTLQSYRSPSPQWTTVLDVDALAKSENANWVWEGYDCAQPAQTRCLLQFSDGGEDARTLREFDVLKQQFVAGGFVLPRAKQDTAWLDANTLLVAREWNPGEVTASGYPYIIKRLKRGEQLSAATEIFRGTKTDVSAGPFTLEDGQGHKLAGIRRGITFFTNEYYVLTPAGARKLNLPLKSDLSGMVHGRVLVSLNQDWTAEGHSFAQGSLVALDLAQLLADPQHLRPSLVYSPGPRESIEHVSATRDDLVLSVYHNVRGRILVFTPSGKNTWLRRRLAMPDNASVDLTDGNLQNNDVFINVRSFLVPASLYFGNIATGTVSVVKRLPALFDASKDTVEQYEATSKDGTKIPYFIVHPKAMRRDGNNPTVINAYGGFQISETPSYSAATGKLWLERGGVYVLANIRGGGEFGPAWHEAGLKTHRQRIYDDFAAVGKDLIDRKITSPRHLGIVGGSNGGLLMGVEFTQHPEMWNAVQIEVPLLDMLRFEKIQAGASWVGEYGSVSVPAERAFLESISPYQNVKAGVAYPEPFIWTTTKDDRVGPQHARKFAAKLAAMHVPYLYYEVIEGGHGAGANIKEATMTSALGWTYFTMKLME